MSWRDFIASVVGSLAWPVVIGACVVMFRKQVRVLLEGPIKRLKAGPFEFETEWERATERVGSSVPTREAFAHRKDSGQDDLDEVLDLAEKAPVPAILAVYDATEEMVRSLGDLAGIEGAQSASVTTLATELARRDLIDQKTEEALSGLVTLRNLAAHGPGTEGRRAREYIVMSEAVMYALSRSKIGRQLAAVPANP
jgi:hypothetical protein